MTEKIFIVFHAKKLEPFVPCMDGLFAAAAAVRAWPSATLVPACYGAPPRLSLKAGDRVYLLDLSYPAHVLEGWIDAGAEVVVIDHHKTAMADLSGLSDRVLQRFDMGKSGAVLAWEYFFPDVPLPRVFDYVQDRDLWLKELPGTERVSLALIERMRGKAADECVAECEQLIVPHNQDGILIVRLVGEGDKVQVEVEAAIDGAIARATHRIVAGDLVPFVRVRGERELQAYSDIGHRLLSKFPGAPFACVETGGGWALRAMPWGEDVSRVAKMLGGGGHRSAAGCRSGNPIGWYGD